MGGRVSKRSYGFHITGSSSLFGLGLEMERLGEVQGRVVQRQVVVALPEVEDVSTVTIGLEAAKDVLLQVDRKSATLAAMQRAGAAALLSASTQAVETTHLGEHLFHADLLPQVCVVDGTVLFRQRMLDGLRRRLYVRGGCGDHCYLRASYPFVARGLFCLRERRGRVCAPVRGSRLARRRCCSRLRQLLVKRPVTGPHAEHLVQQFTHAVSQRDVAPCSLGAQSSIQVAHGRVVLDGTLGSTPEITAHEVRPFPAHPLGAWRKWISLSIHTGGIEFGEDAEVSN